ncbi:MAG TPA: sortase [Candidatus Limnocylindrales bacterium]|nr:sortase [Candidatus Limnocylindrales bacterium]
MPTAARPTRSLLALVLVANLVAVGAPTAALALQRPSDASPVQTTAAWVVPVPADAADRVEAAFAAASTASASADAARPIFAPIPAAWTARPKAAVPTPKPTTVKKGASVSSAPTKSTAKSSGFRGRNHVWIPALGISRSVSGYACSSSFYPANRVYRWGCAGGNNVYLFGHAHSVFKPLHDAYVSGRLRKGMKVYYAGSDGKVSTYAVRWWRLTTPENGAWAYAGQSRPSLTLQTCVGARSQYRLIVRLTRV